MNYSKQWQNSIKFFHLILFYCLYLSFLTGCGQDSASKSSYTNTNLSIELGSDLTVNVGESVNLTASVKNLGSSSVTYQWIQTSGNHIDFAAADDNSYIEFTPLVHDSFEFEVTVTDNQGVEYTDSVIITVVSNLNVELGPDLTVNVGESVHLTAFIKNLGSSTVTYQWIQTSGSPIDLAANNNSYIEFTPLVNDSFKFEVTITDNQGMEYTDSVIITVPPANQSEQYSALLTWAVPTENEDGSSLTNLAGYNIYYGESATNLDTLITVEDPLKTSYNIKNLDSAHSYFFCIAAYNTMGLESQCSDTVELIL